MRERLMAFSRAAGLALLFLALLVPVGAAAATQEPGVRVALVIGNGAYANPEDRLPNPPNDGRAIAYTLRQIGFQVIEAIDQDFSGIRRSLVEFGRALSGAEAGLFYYAGHGMELNGANYLVPVDADLQNESDIYVQTIVLDDVMRVMEAAVPTRLVLLDACRNNPLARRLQRHLNPSRGRTVGRGLAKIDATVGTLIAYATAPGEVAEDGRGSNSPFTTALLRHLPEPNVEVNEMLTRVRSDVVSDTGSQVPWASSSLVGRFFLAGRAPEEAQPAPPVAASAPAAPQLSTSGEALFWDTIKDSTNPADFADYVTRFPNGLFAGIAERRIAVLKPPDGRTVAQPETTSEAPRGPQADLPEQVPAATVSKEPAAPLTPSSPGDLALLLTSPAGAQVPGAAGLPLDSPPSPAEIEQAALSGPGDAAQAIGATNDAERRIEPALDPEAVEQALGLDRSERRAIQAALIELGNDIGAIDGVLGRRSREAIRRWQETQGTAATGYVDVAGRDALVAIGERRLQTAQLEAASAAQRAVTDGGDKDRSAGGSSGRSAGDLRALEAKAVARASPIFVHDGYCAFPEPVEGWHPVTGNSGVMRWRSNARFDAGLVTEREARNTAVDTRMIFAGNSEGFGVAAYIIVRNQYQFFPSSYSADRNHLCNNQVIKWQGWAYLGTGHGTVGSSGSAEIEPGLFGLGGVYLHYREINLRDADYPKCIHFQSIKDPKYFLVGYYCQKSGDAAESGARRFVLGSLFAEGLLP